MPLADYLAQKYLTASGPTKKRKRKAPKGTSSGLIIADDDALGWNTQANEEEEDGRPLTLGTGSAEFRKAKANTWKTVGVPAPKDAEQDAADRIISQAAEDSRLDMEDEGPVIEGRGQDESGVVKMSDGSHAGLQSAAAVKAQFEKRKKEEKEAWEREQSKRGKGTEETVYRDATGRRIDISMRRAEAKKEIEEKAKKEREEKEIQKGDVQRAEKEKRREELDEARFMPLARTVDDIDMNAEMREAERWNDPAAQFLTGRKEGKSKSGKPLYKGAAAPNRYGIRPGHKWDGVDRGNGWEAERFKALNRTSRNKDLEYTWQMDT
ncbi:Pre-mRNA-splicing factor cwc26 [Hyphodiscus hymeniophilus]|uniref:Pre-mRNA-splicing factor cwc26 n=1 Tax=Hyphodiscus hymeniophilus TaxID=353542 RepID=A0A9P6VN42_9HELO|nr:Pre-mRNA-splicing factor cwc26 [Hyphodiscus hymeniophilus]